MADTECKLCYNTFSTKHPLRVPRNLSCPHTHCTECIQKLFERQGQAIECPQCHVTTIVPQDGVDYLEKNFAIMGLTENSKEYEKCKNCVKTTYPPKSATMHCLDCNKYFCGACSDNVHLKIENQNHLIRLSHSRDDLRLNRMTSGASSARSGTPGDERRPINLTSPLDECPEHGLPLKIYCKHDKVMCCTLCRTSTPQHKQHDCFKMNADEEKERQIIFMMQDEVDEQYERYLHARGVVQTTIEELKENSARTSDEVSRAFRVLRTTVDDTEKALQNEVEQITNTRLVALRKQLSLMIETSSTAKTVSRGCEEALTVDYFEMLAQKQKLEREQLRVMEEMQHTEPAFPAKLCCQFPNNENIISEVINCGYVVRPCLPPADFKAGLNNNKDISLSWCRPTETMFTYLPHLYLVYASTGINDSFVEFTQVSTPSCIIAKTHPDLLSRSMIQFKVSCVNAVGEGEACNPRCVFMSSSRKLED